MSNKSSKPLLLPAKYAELNPRQRKAVRLEYVRLQENKCWFCLCSLEGLPDKRVQGLKVAKHLFPPNFFEHPVHLHHDHKTGLTLGAVHNKCNAVLWQYMGQ